MIDRRNFASALLSLPFVGSLLRGPSTSPDSSQTKFDPVSQYVLKYPVGRTGNRDNYKLAQEIMEVWLAGGSIVLPQPPQSLGLECSEGGWEMIEFGPWSGFDWDWSEGHELKPGKRWKVTDGEGREYENVTKLNSRSGMIVQNPSNRTGPLFVQTLAPLPITVEQV